MKNYSMKLKRALALVLTFVMAVSVLTVAPNTEVSAAPRKYVKSLKVSKSKLTLESGKKATVNATVKVKGSASKKVKVSLSKSAKKVVSVKVGKPSKKGVSKLTITAKTVKKKTTASVKVVTSGKNSKNKTVSKTIKVTVNPKKTPTTTQQPTTQQPTTEQATTEQPTTEAPKPVVKVTEISVNLAATSILVGKTTKASVTVSPDNATNKDVVYSVDKPSVASINEETGEIEGLKEGAVTVKATAKDGSGISGTAVLNVIGTATLELQKHSASIVIGQSETLAVSKKTPSDATVDYTSSDTAVATVNSDGLVNAIAAGQAVITATSSYGVKDTCTVTVVTDETIIISRFAGLTQDGKFTVDVAMKNPENVVTDAMLTNTVLNLINSVTGSKIQATYVSGSLTEEGTATFAFDRTQLSSGTYYLEAADSSFAIDSGDATDLKQEVIVTELKTGIVGFVYDDAENPIAGAQVVVYAGSAKVATTTTDVSGYYEVGTNTNDGLTVTVKKDGYFDTDAKGIAVVNNEITTCNIVAESVLTNRLAIYGYVSISDASEAQTIGKNTNPKAVLEVEVNGEYQYVGETVVDDNGYYAFANSYYVVGKVRDDNDNSLITYWNTTTALKSALDRTSTYRVTVTKDLEQDNLNAVYVPVTKTVTLSKTQKFTKVADMSLVKVVDFKGLTISEDALAWENSEGIDKPASTADDTQITVEVRTEDGILLNPDENGRVKDYTAEFKKNDQGDQAGTNAVTIIEPNTIQLPAGEYYAMIYNGANAVVYKKFSVDNEGTAIALADIRFGVSVGYTFRVSLNETDVEKITDIQNNDVAYEMDLDREVTNDKVAFSAQLYQVDGTNLTKMGDPYQFTNFAFTPADGYHDVTQKWVINGLVTGKTYKIIYDTKGMFRNTNKAAGDENSFTFTYNPSENKRNENIPQMKAYSVVNNIKLTSANQFEGFDETKAIRINTVKLLNEDKNAVQSIDINKYFTCGNYDTLNSTQKDFVDSEIFGGGDLLTTGISAGFTYIPSGKYYIEINAEGYQSLVVPAQKAIVFIGLCRGDYTVSDDNEFKLVPEVSISGKIKNEQNTNVEDSVAITVLNADKKIVGFGKTTNGEYKITNINDEDDPTKNTTKLNVGETYTLVFRNSNYKVTSIVTRALASGDNTGYDVTLVAGAASLEATISEAGTDQGLVAAGAVVNAYDNLYTANYIDDYVWTGYIQAFTAEEAGLYSLTQSLSNELFWSARVPLGDYKVVVEDTNVYAKTESKLVAVTESGGHIDAGKLSVSRAQKVKTTPYKFKITKLNGVDNNYLGFDLIKVYTVNADGTETLYDQQYMNSATVQTTPDPFDLLVGEYKVYCYSKNYFIGSTSVTVSSISTETVTKDLSLSSAN